jgi:hypothetical protein
VFCLSRRVDIKLTEVLDNLYHLVLFQEITIRKVSLLPLSGRSMEPTLLERLDGSNTTFLASFSKKLITKIFIHS